MIGGKRYWANAGEAIDCESNWAVAQCKEVKTLSLAALTQLAIEAERQGTQKQKVGMVIVKHRAGRGSPTPRLVVLTEGAFRSMSGHLPGDSDGGQG